MTGNMTYALIRDTINENIFTILFLKIESIFYLIHLMAKVFFKVIDLVISKICFLLSCVKKQILFDSFEYLYQK